MKCYFCKEEVDDTGGNPCKNRSGKDMCDERRDQIFGASVLKKGKAKAKQSPTNALTEQVIAYVQKSGGCARRVNVTGRYIEGNPIKVPNGPGRYKTLYTKGKWIKSGMLPGFEDISAVKKCVVYTGLVDNEFYYGQYVAIEVKVGNDRLSQDQVLRKDEVERAGGVYIVARTIEQFIEEWNQI